jgi:hypothetical protein
MQCLSGGASPTSPLTTLPCSAVSSTKALASLPAIEMSASVLDLDELYAAVGLQRLRLHQDQQVPEWTE